MSLNTLRRKKAGLSSRGVSKACGEAPEAGFASPQACFPVREGCDGGLQASRAPQLA